MANKLIVYDNLNNKMVFNLIRGYPETIFSEGFINNQYGFLNHTSEGEGYWGCGTSSNGFEISYPHMRPYFPFNVYFDISMTGLTGFTITELISRGYLTVGVSKKFYTNKDKTDYIDVWVDGEHLNNFGNTVYSTVYMTVHVNNTDYSIISYGGGNHILDAGLFVAPYNNLVGVYGFGIDERTIDTHRQRNCTIYMKNTPASVYLYNGTKPVDQIPVDPDTALPTGGYGNIEDMTGDDIDLPTAPDESISGALANGFLNIYKPTASDLRSFGGALWTNAFNVKWYDVDSVANLVMNAVSDPINFIIGLFMLPVSPTTSGSSGIFLGGLNVNTVSVPKVSKQFVTIDFGSITIEELYGNYLDYSNSRLSIYLPYVGTADLDVQEVNGGTVTLQYIVDVFTGACVANVKCSKTTDAPWGMSYTNSTVHSYSGNMAVQLPISAGSFDTMTQGLINIGLGLGTNTPAIAMQGGKDVIQGFAGDATTRGSLSSNTGKLSYQTPYLMFTRPIECRPANLGNLHGYSAGIGGKLGALKGYVECVDVKLDGVPATDSELNEIESILKSGVYV